MDKVRGSRRRKPMGVWRDPAGRTAPSIQAGAPSLLSHFHTKGFSTVTAAWSCSTSAAAVTVLKPFVWKWDSNEGAPAWMEGAVRPAGSRNTPIGLRRRDPRTLSMLWEDGHRDDFDVRDLRLACHCALCIEEMSGRKLLDPKTVRADA